MHAWGNFPIPKSRDWAALNPGISGLTKFIYLPVFLVLFKIILCIYSFFDAFLSPQWGGDAWSDLGVDDMAQLYDDELTAIFDQLIPLRTITSRLRQSDPWFDEDCCVTKRCVWSFERDARRVRRQSPDDLTAMNAATEAWYTRRREYRELLSKKRENFWRRESTLNILLPGSCGALSTLWWVAVVLLYLLPLVRMRHTSSLTRKSPTSVRRLPTHRHICTPLRRRTIVSHVSVDWPLMMSLRPYNDFKTNIVCLTCYQHIC